MAEILIFEAWRLTKAKKTTASATKFTNQSGASKFNHIWPKKQPNFYIATCAVCSLIATALMTDYTGRDIEHD